MCLMSDRLRCPSTHRRLLCSVAEKRLLFSAFCSPQLRSVTNGNAEEPEGRRCGGRFKRGWVGALDQPANSLVVASVVQNRSPCRNVEGRLLRRNSCLKCNRLIAPTTEAPTCRTGRRRWCVCGGGERGRGTSFHGRRSFNLFFAQTGETDSKQKVTALEVHPRRGPDYGSREGGLRKQEVIVCRRKRMVLIFSCPLML